MSSSLSDFQVPFVSTLPVVKIDPETGYWKLPEGRKWKMAKVKKRTMLQIVFANPFDGEEVVSSSYDVTDFQFHSRSIMQLMHDILYDTAMENILIADNLKLCAKLMAN
jgi:hypothetical protein